MAYELVSWVPGRDRDSAGSLCCVLEENTILSFCLFSPWSMNGELSGSLDEVLRVI